MTHEILATADDVAIVKMRRELSVVITDNRGHEWRSAFNCVRLTEQDAHFVQRLATRDVVVTTVTRARLEETEIWDVVLGHLHPASTVDDEEGDGRSEELVA